MPFPANFRNLTNETNAFSTIKHLHFPHSPCDLGLYLISCNPSQSWEPPCDFIQVSQQPLKDNSFKTHKSYVWRFLQIMTQDFRLRSPRLLLGEFSFFSQALSLSFEQQSRVASLSLQRKSLFPFTIENLILICLIIKEVIFKRHHIVYILQRNISKSYAHFVWGREVTDLQVFL